MSLPYQQDADVWLESGEDKLQVMDQLIEKSGFMNHVQKALVASGKRPEEFAVAIKPNIMTASRKLDPNPVYTDPELVKRLVDWLHRLGIVQIAVVEARNVYDYSFERRTVQAVAEMVGYSESNGYRIVNLTDEKERFDYGSVLGNHYVGRTWRDADFRVSFAKNKTHWRCFYTGCLKNVYGCLPEADKMLHYHGKGREFYECCILIAHWFPVHFAFLDAWVSGDGFSGHVRDAFPHLTRTLFASPNALALDWVMGEKMSIDPSLNYVIQEGMFRWGKVHITRRGNMTPWYPWRNVRPFSVVMLDVLEEYYHLSKFMSRSFANESDPRFPPVRKGRAFFRVMQKCTSIFEKLMVVPVKSPAQKRI